MVRKDHDGFKETFSVAVRTLALVVLPASVGLIVWARPIVRIVFEHGHFNAYSTDITASALYFYAFGLLSCAVIKILVNMFYAMQDTRTPVKTMCFSVSANIVLSLLLMGTLKIGGLALASSLSATLNVGLLYYFLRKKIGALDESKIIGNVSKILGLAVLMGVLASGYNGLVLERLVGAKTLWQGLALLGGIGFCTGIYAGLVLVFRIEEAHDLRRLIFSKSHTP